MKKGVTFPLRFSYVNLPYAFSSNFLVSVCFHVTPGKIAEEWHSVTQAAMFAFLTCFHHHSVWWVFTAVSVGPLHEWSECLGFRRWGTLGAPENPVPSPGSSQKWYNLIVVPCRVLLALCPTQAPPKESVELPGPEGRLWNRRQFYGDAWAPQPSQFSLVTSSALSSHRWSSWNPRMICELRQLTQQMPATNREITSASSPNSVLLSPPRKHCLLFLKVITRIILFNFGDFEYPYLLMTLFFKHKFPSDVVFNQYLVLCPSVLRTECVFFSVTGNQGVGVLSINANGRIQLRTAFLHRRSLTCAVKISHLLQD